MYTIMSELLCLSHFNITKYAFTYINKLKAMNTFSYSVMCFNVNISVYIVITHYTLFITFLLMIGPCSWQPLLCNPPYGTCINVPDGDFYECICDQAVSGDNCQICKYTNLAYKLKKVHEKIFD